MLAIEVLNIKSTSSNSHTSTHTILCTITVCSAPRIISFFPFSAPLHIKMNTIATIYSKETYYNGHMHFLRIFINCCATCSFMTDFVCDNESNLNYTLM